MDQFLINLLNGLSGGLLLFMLSSGLTLIFSMMGVLNFAHASFYMLGAFIGYALSRAIGFWPALLLAPVLTGLIGALFERLALRKVHKFGHVAELLLTFGLSYVVLELVQLVFGRTAVPFTPPEALQGSAFTFIQHPLNGFSMAWGAAPAAMCEGAICSTFPMTKLFMMGVALLMLVSLWLLLTRTRIGLVIQAALTHPEMVESLGHNVPAVFMLVFGSGCALAGLAGVIGGITFVTEPTMAVLIGSIIFVVVVVGGIGSLAGAFVGSIVVGLLQTLPLTINASIASMLKVVGVDVGAGGLSILHMTIAQVAPILPYLLMVLILIFRPKGLLGTRED